LFKRVKLSDKFNTEKFAGYDKCRTFGQQMTYVEKDKKQKKVPVQFRIHTPVSQIHESPPYISTKSQHLIKGFTYKEFKKIADKVPFTQKEWSDMLHISERTLQRYAKDNGSFTFNVIDRIIQIDKVIKRGVEVFGGIEKFISWLRSDPYMLEGRLSLQSLWDFEGINKVLTQLGRIEHGIFA
jgi:putative toxin-antitoxin system antitoxin component (TIGR02293 family)